MSRGMTKRSNSGLIEFEIDGNLLGIIEDALGDLKSKSRRVLKSAVNKTAKQAKERLSEKAQETYVVKKTRFTKAMTTKNATAAKPEATINITGEQLELKDFKVSPATYKPKNRPSVTKAKVLRATGLKALEKSDPKGVRSKTGPKAFLAKFSNGHVSVVQKRTKERFPLKKLLSNSIPKMVGSQKRVYGVIKPHIYDDLMDNIRQEIEKVVNKG